MLVPLKQKRRPWPGAVVANCGKRCDPNDTSGGSPSQQQADAEREQRIDLLRLQLLAARYPDARRTLWQQLKDEIAARSPAQVDRMERERGLRRGEC